MWSVKITTEMNETFSFLAENESEALKIVQKWLNWHSETPLYGITLDFVG